MNVMTNIQASKTLSYNFSINDSNESKVVESKLLDSVTAKPFIKWAGGKTKLLPTIEESLPSNIKSTHTYIEPFVGAGSVFMYMAQNHNFEHIIINDINSALIAIYRNIRDHHEELMYWLDNIQDEYQKLPPHTECDAKKNYYLNIRQLYNTESRLDILGSARFIFLNKYGFNGLYRENSKGENNVAFGKKDKAELYDKFNIMKLNQILNQKNSSGELKITILNGDYADSINYAKTTNAFIYMDPPYRPITVSGFTNYHKSSFNDDSQKNLKNFCLMINNNNANFMLSNSDPKVQKDAAEPEFFDELYKGCDISRVSMRRNINCDASKRGAITELLITNYKKPNKEY